MAGIERLAMTGSVLSRAIDASRRAFHSMRGCESRTSHNSVLLVDDRHHAVVGMQIDSGSFLEVACHDCAVMRLPFV